jgi:hypothetical protein
MILTCADCGNQFEGVRSNILYCPECRRWRKAEYERAYRAKQMETSPKYFLAQERATNARWRARKRTQSLAAYADSTEDF